MVFKNLSWVDVKAESHFPLQNLPYGVFRRDHDDEGGSIGVAIGDHILDLRVVAERGLLKGKALGDGSCFKEV
jgi:fumarylacetoacetase